MSNLPTVFNFEDMEVRVIMLEGEPWFVAADVCKALEIVNATDALKRLDPDERTLVSIEGASNRLPVNTINEPGLYSLIMASRKSEAKKFKRWITHEVIPSIRKTGSYSVQQQPMAIEDLIIMQAQSMKDMKMKVAQLETELSEARNALSVTQQQAEKANIRMDAWDNIGPSGDKRQKLNKMIQKYAAVSGFSFQKAWKEFKAAYNTAYRTNLTSLMNHFKEKHGIKKLTLPDYLERAHSETTPVLDDAIRVADKLINQAEQTQAFNERANREVFYQ